MSCHCDEHYSYASRRAKRKQYGGTYPPKVTFATRTVRAYSLIPRRRAVFFARRPSSSRPEAFFSKSAFVAFVGIKKTVNTTSDSDLRSRTRCPALKTGATPLIASFSSLSRRRRRERSRIIPHPRPSRDPRLVAAASRTFYNTKIQIHAT